MNLFTRIGNIKALFLMLLLSGFFEGTAFTQEQITLAINEYPPFTSSKLPSHGLVSEIVIAAYNQSGYKVNLVSVPFNRGYKSTQNGDFDGFFTVWRRDHRERWFLFSDPLYTVKFGFFRLKKRAISYTSLDDLRKYTIGTVRGYAYPEQFIQAELNHDDVSTEAQNIKRLHAGRIDLALTSFEVGNRLIKEKYPAEVDQFAWVEPALQYEQEYLVISKKTDNPQQKIDAFNHGLKQIKRSGIFDRILKKHKIQLTLE